MEQPHIILKVLQAFTTPEKEKIKLTKIEKVSDHQHSQPITLGTTITGTLEYKPKIGESFNLENATLCEGDSKKEFDLWCTSVIVKFLPGDMFETLNSVYKFEITK